MSVGVSLPPDHGLESVHDGVEPLSELSAAFFEIGDMAHKDGCLIVIFKLTELVEEPLEHIPRVSELNHGLKVGLVADVRVEGDHFRLQLA